MHGDDVVIANTATQDGKCQPLRSSKGAHALEEALSKLVDLACSEVRHVDLNSVAFLQDGKQTVRSKAERQPRSPEGSYDVESFVFPESNCTS